MAGKIFSALLIAGVLNLTFVPNFVAYAEEGAPIEQVAPASEPPVAESPSETGSQTVVDTGGAVSQSGIENGVNTNVVNTETQTAEQETEQSQTEPASLNIQNENTAEVQNVSTTTAETGNNTASGTETVIVTGDAVANADVVSLVNTNIVESEGDIVAGGGSLGDSNLDLRQSFGGGNSGGCDSCLTNVSISDQNVATVTNDIVVTAETGENNASSTEASIIATGDAYAGANVVNIVNTNIVKSNYLLLVFNNFGDWSGDLVFPNGDFFKNFFAGFSSGCSNCGGDTNISNDNNANVSNSVNTSADSGQNTADGGGSIVSGNSDASSNIYNQINTNIYGGSSFYLRIKVFGDWNGSIFNLPENIVWGRTADGLILYDRNGDNPFTDQTSGASNIMVQNVNSADVVNNVDVRASTGNNSASGANSSIQTGNAYAGANVVNIVNTNVISSNWTAALVNIFGNWQGNVSFGQPDLWIGTIAESSGTLTPGSSVKFITTIRNNGDATASGIRVLAEPQSPFLSMSGGNEWFLSPLAAGESKEISYYGNVAGDLPTGSSNIPNKTSVFLSETDANLTDNSDILTLTVYNEPAHTIILPYTSRTTTYPNLEVVKTHSLKSSINTNGIEMVPFGGSADYKIVVRNNGGSAFEGVLFDQLIDKAGKVVNQQNWNLGEILPNEEITITYTTEFTASTTPGTYTNYAWVEALGGDYSYDRVLASEANSNVASDKIIIAAKPIATTEKTEKILGEVLGMLTKNVYMLNQEEQYEYVGFLGGFCLRGEENKMNKKTVLQSVLLGLSFVLIMQRRKNIPSNLFLI